MHVLADLRRLEEKIKQRLEWSDTKLLRLILVFIETQSWVQKEGDGDEEMHEIYLAVDYTVSNFRAPLEARGLCVDVLQDQVHEAVEFTWKYLPLGQESYRKILYQLHTCPNSSSWSNVLMLCELVFSLPFSTSCVEQMFSVLKTIKAKCRANLQTCSLNDLLEIYIRGPPLTSFNANATVELWWKECSTTRRVSQKPCKECCSRAQDDPANEGSELEDDVNSTFALDDWDKLTKTN